MIISKIQGGLANQMFQYAYGRHLSYINNTEFYLDRSFYNHNQGSVVRYFQLDKFEKTHCYFDIKSLDGKPVNIIKDDFIYKEFLISDYSHYYLDGYWQSEKYFKGSEDMIRNDFSPTQETLSKLIKTPLIDTNTVSMHIRRTDYTTSNGYHPVQSIDYYKNAIDQIGDYDYIFIFSDDIKWCKENLKFENMIFMEGFTDIEDLFLQSLCRNNIIANSSFSWWGAWLNNNSDKKVIAPKNWFGYQANLNDSDIIPDSWIKI